MNWLERKILLHYLKQLLQEASTMKLSTHLIWQALAMILQAANQYSDILPPKWKPFIALAIGLIQVLLGWHAHYYNPDGTPASVAYVPPDKPTPGGTMKCVTLFLSVMLLMSVASVAQNAPLPTQTWSTTFAPMSVPGIGQTFAGTIADVGVSPTPNTTFALETIQAPGSPDFQGFYGGAANYRLNALSTWLNNVSPNLSGYRFQFTLLGSVGVVRATNGNHFGATAGARIDYALTTTGTWTLGVETRALRLPYTTQGWKPGFSFGPAIHF